MGADKGNKKIESSNMKATQWPHKWRVLTGLALLLSFLSLSMGVWQQWQMLVERQNRSQQMHVMQSSMAEWQRMHAMLQAHQTQIAQLQEEVGRIPGVTQMHVEVVYLLRLANAMLKVNAISSAISLLEVVEQRLKDSPTHQLDSRLRPALTQDLADLSMRLKLHQAAWLSIHEVIRQIGEITEANVKLPPRVLSAKTDEHTDNIFKRNIHKLKQLLVIRHWDRKVAPLLEPGHVERFKQQVQLCLYQAEWALLNGNLEVYRHSLTMAIEALAVYVPGQSVTAPLIEKLQDVVKRDILNKPISLRSLWVLREDASSEHIAGAPLSAGQ